MVGSEENLFRRFRLSWVPTWVPDWAEAALRSRTSWKLLAILLCAATLSYGAFSYFQQHTEQEFANIDAWKQRLVSASPAEFPVVLDQLFHVKNERALALGIDYLRSMNLSQRQAAGLALRDATERWNAWPANDGSRQWERAVRILAQIADQLHAPEQALAVELARQSLNRPVAADSSIRASLLSSSQQIFSQSHSAHTAGTDLANLGTANLGTGNFGEAAATFPGTFPGTGYSTRPANRDPWSTDDRRSSEGTRDPVTGADLQATTRGDGIRADARESVRFLPAGYSRSPLGTGNSGRNRPSGSTEHSLLPQTSQIPLFDETGRLIETQSVDPASLTVPGGLIPVGISSQFRKANPVGSGNSDRGTPYSAIPNRGSEPESRIGSSRVDWGEGPPAGEPFQGNPPAGRVEDSQRRELEAAFQVRTQTISASGPSRNLPGQSRVPVQQGSSRSNIAAEPEVEVFTSRPEISDPNLVGSGSAGRPAQRQLPSNPYRARGATPAGERTGDIHQDAVRNFEDAASTTARRLRFTWDQMSHIDVMQHLRDPDPLEARRAVQELTRRGFNADYIAVARRLTSPSAQERYQLVFDLVASSRVEPTPFLRWLANDLDPDVRSVAIEAIELLNSLGKNRGADATTGLGQVR